MDKLLLIILVASIALTYCSVSSTKDYDCKDPNSEPGCGLNCNKQCSSYGRPPIKCPSLECPPYGCECKDGYYYNPDIKRCVLPCDCPPSDD